MACANRWPLRYEATGRVAWAVAIRLAARSRAITAILLIERVVSCDAEYSALADAGADACMWPPSS